MNIDLVLEKISDKVEKDKKYLKGLYNKEKAELIENFGSALTEERMDSLSLIRVGKKYGMTKADVDAIIEEDVEFDGSESNDEIADYLDNIEEEEDTFIADEIEVDKDESTKGYIELDDDDDLPDEGNAWKRFLDTVPVPEFKTKEYVRTPSIIIEIGPTYYFKLVLGEEPHPHEFEGKYGTYTRTAFKVDLVKVSDEDLYSVKYERGDFEGELAFVNGKRYTLWLDEKAVGFFKLFWKKLTVDGLPDDRTFTFKKSKKGNYNVWKFGLPK